MKITLITFTALVLSSFAAAFGQAGHRDSTDIRRSLWGASGLGGSSLGALSFMANGNAEIQHHWLLSVSAQAESSTFFNLTAKPTTGVNTYGVLAGKIIKPRFAFFTISAGAALVNVYTHTNPGLFGTGPQTRTSRYTIGFPILLQGYGVLFRALGVGLSGYVNINSVKTTSGIHMSMAVGRLTTRKNRYIITR
ncbi:MAG: hypothetical protein JWP94_1521 [Mucilaginibacter sp.]|nr:hypothetical protein [Mucilaginibacter sp.]